MLLLLRVVFGGDGLVDPGDGREPGWFWAAVPESNVVRRVGGIEGRVSLGPYLGGGAVVDRGGGVVADAGMTVLVVVIIRVILSRVLS